MRELRSHLVPHPTHQGEMTRVFYYTPNPNDATVQRAWGETPHEPPTIITRPQTPPTPREARKGNRP